MLRSGDSRSRRKNWPRPARSGGPAVAGDVPRDAEARRDVVVVLVHAATGSAPPRRRGTPASCAPVRAGRLQQAVARIVAERRVEERRDEARDVVVVRVRVEEASSSARRCRPSRAGDGFHESRDVDLEVRHRCRTWRPRRRSRRSRTSCRCSRKSARMLPVVGAVAVEAGRAPEGASSDGAVADRVLVLLVEADEHAGLDEVLAEDLRVVVLDDEQVLVVEEGRLVPERLRIPRRPRRPDGRCSSPYCFLSIAERSAGWRSRISRVQLRVQPPRGDRDLVRGVRELQAVVARCCRASGSARRRTTCLGWSQLESTAGNGSSPQRFALTLGASFFQLSCV